MPPSKPAQEPLLPSVARGDAEAVTACIDRYSSLVWSLARGVSRDMALVEDLVQEIFIDLWKSAARFDPSKSAEATFVATIARRRVIDRRRRIGRRPDEDPIEDHTVGRVDASLELVDLRDEAAQAAEAVGRLRPDQRRVLLMAVVDGLTHRQIAETTGIPLGTVKSHVRRGLEKVAAQLGGRVAEERTT